MSVTTKDSLLFKVASILAPSLSLNQRLSRSAVNEAMSACFGEQGRLNGAWTQRDSFDVIEVALSLHIKNSPANVDPAEDITYYRNLMNMLPTQTVRSEIQVNYQQFSTPADIAALVAAISQISAEDVVLEPSAGTGILAAFAARTSANIYVNELETHRRALLSHAFGQVTGFDAAKISTFLTETIRPTVILMNPPFARNAGIDDPSTAARHLSAALKLLAPGGRLVAVMPEQFAPNSARSHFKAVVGDNRVVASISLLKGTYGKHGTNVAVRIVAIDKVFGAGIPVTIVRQNALEAWNALTELPGRANLKTIPPMNTTSQTTGDEQSLFASAAKAISKPAPARPAPKTDQNVIALSYTTLDNPAHSESSQGLYVAYRPSRIVIDNASKHPTQLVESQAMASVAAPPPNSAVKLPSNIIAKNLLSDAQLETVIYANNAWNRWLPGQYVYDKQQKRLELATEGRRHRYGYFLADGTGAGKGRQIAACIMSQWVRGKKRHIWLSKNEALLEDAQRDWVALGGLATDIIPLSRWKIRDGVELSQAILFVPYGTLRSQREDSERLQQIVNWAGSDFDGVIAFDEAHELGRAAGGEGAFGETSASLQGLAGVSLQHQLPSACILYASATGASDVNNFAYAVRLGLWGMDTSFTSREHFISEIREGGIAAMELVVRDLKASGLYCSRVISFEGVEYDVLQHELTEQQIDLFNQYADIWTIIHQNLHKVLEITGIKDDLNGNTLNAQAKASALSRFEGTKQRFFNQLLLSMKLPSLIPDIEESLETQQSAVIQLVTTAEAALNRHVDNLSPEDFAELDIDLSPREAISGYLNQAFPVNQMIEYVDDTGTKRSSLLLGPDGAPVMNPEAVRIRDGLLELLGALPPMPTALDEIIRHFGSANVAEVTGRSRRIIVREDGQQVIEARSASSNIAETHAFMDGRKRILVFSNAGGTGRSYHASLDAKNQQRRQHYLLEPGWRAEAAVQGLGRTHRTHQACAPIFRPVTTNCKGELRFTSTIARRLDNLGALTRGQRQTGGQNLFDPADNLESAYAKMALSDWYRLLAASKLESVNLQQFQDITGLNLLDQDGCLKDDLPSIQRWLNRLLAMRIETQNAIFEEFAALVQQRVQAAVKAGTYDHGVETLVVDEAEIFENTLIRTDPITQAETHMVQLRVAWKPRIFDLNDIISQNPNKLWGYYINTKSNRVAALFSHSSGLDLEGDYFDYMMLVRPHKRYVMNMTDIAEGNWRETTREEFQPLWDAECAALAGDLRRETLTMVTGLLLPLWSYFDRNNLRVTRLADKQGNSWLGRIVEPSDIYSFLSRIGFTGAFEVDRDALITSILDGGDHRSDKYGGLVIKTRRVGGQKLIEVTSFDYRYLEQLKSLGCFTEIIAFKTRLFVPRDNATSILTAII